MFLGGNETLTLQEKSYIEKFKDKAKQFWALWNKLAGEQYDMATRPLEIQSQYSDLISRGQSIKSTIETVTGAIDKAAATYQDVKNWLAEKFGLNGVEIDEKTGQLGIIPLIPIAIIGASLAAMGKWVLDAYEFSGKLDKMKELESQGMSPSEAAAVVEKSLIGQGMFAGAGNLVPLALLGVAALMFLRK